MAFLLDSDSLRTMFIQMIMLVLKLDDARGGNEEFVRDGLEVHTVLMQRAKIEVSQPRLKYPAQDVVTLPPPARFKQSKDVKQ
eukprot:451321-Amphidinium_carterae.2